MFKRKGVDMAIKILGSAGSHVTHPLLNLRRSGNEGAIVSLSKSACNDNASSVKHDAQSISNEPEALQHTKTRYRKNYIHDAQPIRDKQEGVNEGKKLHYIPCGVFFGSHNRYSALSRIESGMQRPIVNQSGS